MYVAARRVVHRNGKLVLDVLVQEAYSIYCTVICYLENSLGHLVTFDMCKLMLSAAASIRVAKWTLRFN